MSYCVTTLPPLGSSWSGTKSVRSEGDITTPAACIEICRALPSIFFAISIISFTSSSFLYNSFSSGVISIALAIVIGNPCEPIGMSLEIWSPVLYG